MQLCTCITKKKKKMIKIIYTVLAKMPDSEEKKMNNMSCRRKQSSGKGYFRGNPRVPLLSF